MAGDGSRFGFKFKPFMKLGDQTFIEHAVEPFYKWKKYIDKVYFIYRQDQEEEFEVESVLRKNILFGAEQIVPILMPHKTKGPLETINYALKERSIKNGIVCDCDHKINVDQLFKKIIESEFKKSIVPVWSIDEAQSKNWSKIVIDHNKIINIVEKEDVDFNRHLIWGMLGCIYFPTFEYFVQTKGFYVSDVCRHILETDNNLSLCEIKQAYFFGDPAMLADCVEKRRGECSVFCDIDGVLLEHKNHSTTDTKTNILLEGFDKLRLLSRQNHTIILTTARHKKFRKRLSRLLKKKGIYYDELIMGLPSGPRFLINDRKPNKPFTRQAVGCEVKRNGGLGLFDLDEIVDNNKTKIILDLSENSFAKTFLLENKNKRFVRKQILKSMDPKHVDVLKRQKRDLERFNFLAEGLCPQVFGENENELEYYYDMEYLFNHTPLSNWDDEAVQINAIALTLAHLEKYIYSLSKPTDGTAWLKSFLNEKIYPKFDKFSLLNDEFRAIIENDTLLINNKKYYGLRRLFEILPLNDLVPKNISAIHGDLTLENIMYDQNSDSIKLIDMDGSRLFDAKELDLGKLSQSILCKYGLWKNVDGDELVKDYNAKHKSFGVMPKFFEASGTLLENALFESWQTILEGSKQEVKNKAVFYMSTYFIRFVPFRIQLGKKHGIFALLMATVWLNKLIGEKGEY